MIYELGIIMIVTMALVFTLPNAYGQNEIVPPLPPQNENGSVPMEVGKVPLGSVPMEDYDPDGKVPLGSVPMEELEHLVKVEKIVNYCYENASNSPNPVKDLVDKGLAEQQFTNQTCGSLKLFYDESMGKIK